MGIEHLTPIEVATRMDEIQNRIAKGITILDSLFAEWQDAELAFDAAEAAAYVRFGETPDGGHPCPAHERKSCRHIRSRVLLGIEPST